MKTMRRIANGSVILAIFVFQLATPILSRAQDATPPSDTATEEASSDSATAGNVVEPTENIFDASATPTLLDGPSPDATIVGELATDTPAAPDATETVVPDETLSEDLAPTPATILQDSSMVVVDETGAEIPLSDPAAAEILSTSDPVWCPGLETPATDNDAGTPGNQNGCTPAQASLTDLINTLQGDPTTYNGDGTIFFQSGAYDSTTAGESAAILDSSYLSSLGALAVEGGWDLTNNVKDGTVPTTTFTVPVVINWNNDVSLKDLIVNLPVGDLNGDVYVSTTGDITVDNVSVSGGAEGIDLINYPGTGDVMVNTADISNTTNNGMLIVSAGTVIVDDVTQTNDTTMDPNLGYNGLIVDNSLGTGSLTVTNSTFSGNLYAGVSATTAGSLTISNVTTQETCTAGPTPTCRNSFQGAYLLGRGTANIFVIGSTFTGSTDTGIEAIAQQGNVTLDSVDVSNNGTGFGAWLKSYDGGSVTVLGGSFQNADVGIFAVGTAASGDAVNLYNVTAQNNNGDGAIIMSGWVFACFPPEAVTLTVDSGTYQTNGGYGFEIFPGPAGTATLATTLGAIVYGGNGAGDNNIDPTLTCNPPAPEEEKPVPPYNRVDVPDEGGTPVPSDCVDYSGTVLVLPDESQVKMACPAEGDMLIERNTEDGLPGKLPLGPKFVDSITISLDKDGQPVKVLTDGGYFLVSFVVPEEFQNKFLSVLFWDETANNGAGAWVEMPREQFLGQEFPLHPKNADDGMTILRGVQQADNLVTLKVNFTGTFVLIAR